MIDHKATANQKMAIQFAILVAAAGAVGTLMFTGFIDGQLLARARARGIDGKPAAKRAKGQRFEPDEVRSRGTNHLLSELPPLEKTFTSSRSLTDSLKQ